MQLSRFKFALKASSISNDRGGHLAVVSTPTGTLIIRTTIAYDLGHQDRRICMNGNLAEIKRSVIGSDFGTPSGFSGYLIQLLLLLGGALYHDTF